jgi:hypothetical protein
MKQGASAWVEFCQSVSCDPNLHMKAMTSMRGRVQLLGQGLYHLLAKRGADGGLTQKRHVLCAVASLAVCKLSHSFSLDHSANFPSRVYIGHASHEVSKQLICTDWTKGFTARVEMQEADSICSYQAGILLDESSRKTVQANLC